MCNFVKNFHKIAILKTFSFKIFVGVNIKEKKSMIVPIVTGFSPCKNIPKYNFNSKSKIGFASNDTFQHQEKSNPSFGSLAAKEAHSADSFFKILQKKYPGLTVDGIDFINADSATIENRKALLRSIFLPIREILDVLGQTAQRDVTVTIERDTRIGKTHPFYASITTPINPSRDFPETSEFLKAHDTEMIAYNEGNNTFFHLPLIGIIPT